MRGHPSSAARRPGGRYGLVLAIGVGLGMVAAGALVGTGGGPRGDVVGLASAQGDPVTTPQGLAILGSSCANSDLGPHTGFQEAPRCVSTAFGEVSQASQNPTLLITRAPAVVRAGQPFELRISTRNLVRDRFLGAAAGGYYLESSYLTVAGLQRGHFHTACRMLESTRRAPDPAPVPAFFKATEDGGGSETPDTVTVTVPGLPSTGVAQCAVWAGDGSHRIPMMQRANEIPAFDSVRVVVRPARRTAAPAPSASASAPAPAPSSPPTAAEPAPAGTGATGDPAADPTQDPAQAGPSDQPTMSFAQPAPGS